MYLLYFCIRCTPKQRFWIIRGLPTCKFLLERVHSFVVDIAFFSVFFFLVYGLIVLSSLLGWNGVVFKSVCCKRLQRSRIASFLLCFFFLSFINKHHNPPSVFLLKSRFYAKWKSQEDRLKLDIYNRVFKITIKIRNHQKARKSLLWSCRAFGCQRPYFLWLNSW